MSIIGADFLKHFLLLVDMHNQKLIDTLTCSSIHGVSCRTLPLSPVWQLVAPTNPYQSILSEFPSLTRPSSLSAPVKHSITHSITTTGPPIRSRPRRLPPDRLQIARRELDHIL